MRVVQFVGELVRVCAPGGRILVVTWCHRDLLDTETDISAGEKALLDRICSAYYLPAWCSTADYVRMFEAQGLKVPNPTVLWS